MLSDYTSGRNSLSRCMLTMMVMMKISDSYDVSSPGQRIKGDGCIRVVRIRKLVQRCCFRRWLLLPYIVAAASVVVHTDLLMSGVVFLA